MKGGKLILMIALLLLAGVGVLFLPIQQWFAGLEGYVHALGAIGPVVVALTYIVTTVLFIPGSALTIGAGSLFGLTTGFFGGARRRQYRRLVRFPARPDVFA